MMQTVYAEWRDDARRPPNGVMNVESSYEFYRLWSALFFVRPRLLRIYVLIYGGDSCYVSRRKQRSSAMALKSTARVCCGPPRHSFTSCASGYEPICVVRCACI